MSKTICALLQQYNQKYSTFWFDELKWETDEDSANSYIYEGPNGEVYGMLGYADQARVNNIYTVQDAVVTQKGDVYQLDGNLKGMVAQNGYTYQK